MKGLVRTNLIAAVMLLFAAASTSAIGISSTSINYAAPLS